MVSLKQRLNNLNGWQRLWVVFSFLALLASLVATANLAQFETTDEKLVEQLADPRCKPFIHIDVPYRYVGQLLDSTTFHQPSPAVQLLVYKRVAVRDKEFQRLSQSDQSTIRYEVLQTEQQPQGDSQPKGDTREFIPHTIADLVPPGEGEDPNTPYYKKFYDLPIMERLQLLITLGKNSPAWMKASDKERIAFIRKYKLILPEEMPDSLLSITFDSYEMLIRCHLKPALGYIALRDLRPEHLQHFYNEKMQQGASARTVRYCHTLLHGALAHAEKHQLIARNVSKLTELPREARKEINTLTLDQVTAKLLPASAQDRLFAAIFLAFGTGLRRGELLALRWKDVDVKTGTLQVRQTLVRVTNHNATEGEGRTRLMFQEPKTPQSRRTVPIPEECLAALKQHKARQAEEKLLLGQAHQDHGLVFCQADVSLELEKKAAAKLNAALTGRG